MTTSKNDRVSYGVKPDDTRVYQSQIGTDKKIAKPTSPDLEKELFELTDGVVPQMYLLSEEIYNKILLEMIVPPLITPFEEEKK